MHVGDPGVRAAGEERGHHVGRVAREVDPARRVAVGDQHLRPPRQHAGHLQVRRGDAEGGAQDRGPVPFGLTPMRRGEGGSTENPAPAPVDRGEGAGRVRVLDLAEVELAALHHVGQVGAEVHARHRSAHRAATGPADAQGLPDRATGAVGGEQVPGAYPALRPVTAIDEPGGDAALILAGTVLAGTVLAEAGQLGLEADVRARVFRGPAEHRFQQVLRDQARLFRADVEGADSGRASASRRRARPRA